MVACTLPPSLTSSSSSSSASSSTSSAAHPYHRFHISRACTQREHAAHILDSPFTIASSTPMADQHHQHAYQYLLDGTGISLDIEKSPHGHQNQSQSQSQGQGQNQTQMSPPNSTSTTHSASAALMYHPYAHPHHPSYAPSLHHGSQSAHMDQTQTLTLDPAQLRTSSVGPSRVLTRRQARMAAAHAFTNTSQETQQQQQQQQQFEENFGLYGGSANSPRPQTPNGFHAVPQYADAHIGLPDLNIGQITIPNTSALSPQHPSTPASVTSSSNFSHYGFAQYAPNGHSRSGSSSTHPRSTSPAASVVSAATSLSSGSGPKSGRSRPPVSSSSVGCISVASFTSTPTDTAAVKPKRRLQNRQRKEICQYYIDHPNSRQEDIAARWGVERSTVSKILKHKNRWMAVSDGDDQVVAKHRPPKFGDIEHEMGSWLVECRDSRTPISDAMIRAKALECARYLSIPDDKFKASAGWVENYKHRANIKKGVWVGKPLPGVYSDDETDDDGPFLSDIIAERNRAQALKEADERVLRIADGLETDIEIPGIDLGPSHMTLGDAGDWPPPLGLAFSGNGTTNATGLNHHLGGTNNGTGEPKDGQSPLNCQLPASYPNEGGLLQQHFAAARAAWAANGGTATSNVAGCPPPVSAQEASSAMDTVLRFLQTQRPDFLNEQERNIVTDVKHLIWVTAAQAASACAAANSASAAAAAAAGPSIATGAVGNGNTTGGAAAPGGITTGGEAVSVQAS